MYKVSVIVPVYKVEKYLPACLDSLSRQTYENFELILVDDGSPDSCGEMCEEYAKSHPNTRVIHQENAGLSVARNNAVKVAAGEYITFVDSDDYVSDDYVEYLVSLAEKYDADMTIGNSVKFNDGDIPKIVLEQIADNCHTPAEALSKMCYGEYPIFACGKLYKRTLSEKYPYPAGALYEDLATTYKIAGNSQKIAYGSKAIYYWRQRTGSITHEDISERHLYGITATKNMLEYITANYPTAIPAAQVRCVNKIIDIAYRIVMGNKNKDMFMRTHKAIIPFVKPILKNKHSSITVKLRTVCLSLGYIPFLIVSKIYSKVKK